jgi:hypothetical protein
MADRVVALVADGSVLRARHQHRVEALARPRPRAFLYVDSVVCNVLRPTCRRAVPCVPCEYARNAAARLLWGFGLGFSPIALRCLGISDGRADDQRLSGSVPSHRGSVIASVTQFKQIAPTVMRSNHTDASSFCSHVSAHRDHPSPGSFPPWLVSQRRGRNGIAISRDACGCQRSRCARTGAC